MCHDRCVLGTSRVLAVRNAAENVLALSRAFDRWSVWQDGYVIADLGIRGCRVVVTQPSGDPAATIDQMMSLAREPWSATTRSGCPAGGGAEGSTRPSPAFYPVAST